MVLLLVCAAVVPVAPARAGLNDPELSVSISGPATVPAGDPVTYTVRVANTALHTTICVPMRGGGQHCFPITLGSEADNVTVTFTLPGGFSFAGTPVGGGGFMCTTSGSVATCTGGTVFSDDAVIITVPATASTTVGSFTATGAVDPANAIPERSDPNDTNNTAAFTLSTLPLPNLTATESASPTSFKPWMLVTYQINLFNLGAGAANNFSVQMFTNLPAFLDSGSFGAGLGCNATGGPNLQLQINCSGGSLPPFSSATLRVTVKLQNQSTPPGTPFTLFGNLDPGNAIHETSELDNSFTAAAIVQ